MAAYISGNGIRPGYIIVYNKELYRVMSSEHRTPGNKRAFCQAKLRNLKNGTQTEVKFRADEQVERASLEQANMEYLYSDASGFCFMNSETYEQMFIDDEIIADAKQYLLPNTKVTVEFHEDKPIGLELPEFVELTVEDTEPQMKGSDRLRKRQTGHSGNRAGGHRAPVCGCRREGPGIDHIGGISRAG